jgi:hypothetical protein
VDAGGYLACLAILLGLPALGYAMVADRSIAALSASEREKMHDRIAKLLEERANELKADGYLLQVFRPDWRRARLLPFYDPFKIGPKDGWAITEPAPQAITGSAWVAREYTFAQEEKLRDADFRLTAEQQVRYADLTGVAAAPVIDERGERLAVLTICTRETHPGMNSDEFVNLHLRLTDELSHDLRRIVGPLDFPSVTPAIKEDKDSGRMPITRQLVASLPSTDEAAKSFKSAFNPEAREQLQRSFASWLTEEEGFPAANLEEHVPIQHCHVDLVASKDDEIMIVEIEPHPRLVNAGTIYELLSRALPDRPTYRQVRRALVVPAERTAELRVTDIAEMARVETYAVWQNGRVSRVL